MFLIAANDQIVDQQMDNYIMYGTAILWDAMEPLSKMR